MNFEISLTSEQLQEGTPEERATFGMFCIDTSNATLTEGYDYYSEGHRPGPMISGYHAAEWLMWNWWRLTCEPRAKERDWWFAHHMPSIGEGYVWPNLVVFSDGVTTRLISSRSASDAKPFRFHGAQPLDLPTARWESAVDKFVGQVLGRLEEHNVTQTNLHRLWNEVKNERNDPETQKIRRVEALFGCDPDASEDNAAERLIAEEASLGANAILEVAANHATAHERDSAPLTANDFDELAKSFGELSSPGDAVRLRGKAKTLKKYLQAPAWRLGVATAKALRKQEHLGMKNEDSRLAEMAGVLPRALQKEHDGASLSFALQASSKQGTIVLRSKWNTGRRFDLARIIGDRIMFSPESLRPVTQAYTYRQKAQRAFAAEFLSPFSAISDMLAENIDDEERHNEVADFFGVSPQVIESQLMNNECITRRFLND